MSKKKKRQNSKPTLTEELGFNRPFTLLPFLRDIVVSIIIFTALRGTASLFGGDARLIIRGMSDWILIPVVFFATRAYWQIFGKWTAHKVYAAIEMLDKWGFAVVFFAGSAPAMLFTRPHTIEHVPPIWVWPFAWIIGSIQLLSRARRTALIDRLALLRWFGPILYSATFTSTSLQLFAYQTMSLHIPFDNVGDAYQLPAVQVASLYIWQFAKSIPLLDAPATLKWNKPLEYQSHTMGALIIIFQATVTFATIALIRTYRANHAK